MTFGKLYRYIFKEAAIPFFITLFVFTGILFLARSIKLFDLVVNSNVPAQDILFFFALIIPKFLEIAAPMALLLAIIVAFGRLSGDSELVVLRACGIRLKQLAPPVLLFAALVSLLTVILGLWIRPWSNYQFSQAMFELAKRRASSGLIAGIFNDFGPLVIYPETISGGGERLTNVIIADRRNPNRPSEFIARYGQIVSDSSRRTLQLRLFEGSIHERSGSETNVTYFDINNITLPFSDLAEGEVNDEGKASEEMYFHELNEAIAGADTSTEAGKKKWLEYLVELHSRLAIPFSALCVALSAMALGIQPSRGGRTWGPSISITVGIALIVTYYFLFAVTKVIGEQGTLPPQLIIWMPNVLLLSISLYLFKQVESERWLAVTERFGDAIKSTATFFSKKRQQLIAKEHVN